jgi:SAM-dependent methyltransferase
MTRLDDLASLLRCPRCRATAWTVTGAGSTATMACASCGAVYRSEDGVLDLGEGDEDARVGLERRGVRLTERNPTLGGINAEFDDLGRAEGALKEAILALPYGNDSRYYREPGYFSNVRASVAAFEFLQRDLGARAGERLLDLGADLTWSTCHFARRGLRCTALDINHHLSVGGLFSAHYGVEYNLVRADMGRIAFRDDTFDIVLAVNALHHSGDIGDVAANIARMLRRGGRLGFIEPYCASEAAKAEFGRAQIDAGISERTYLLQEWHAAFAQAGLEVRALRVCDSFGAVYRKPKEDDVHARERAGDGGLFAGFYRARLSVAGDPTLRVTPGRALDVPLAIENRGNAVWCSASQFPVYATYHLHRVDDRGTSLVAFENPRTPLPTEIAPGQDATVVLQIASPGQPGDYMAEIDLVHEYVSWFAPHGVQPASVRFRVGD